MGAIINKIYFIIIKQISDQLRLKGLDEVLLFLNFKSP